MITGAMLRGMRDEFEKIANLLQGYGSSTGPNATNAGTGGRPTLRVGNLNKRNINGTGANGGGNVIANKANPSLMNAGTAALNTPALGASQNA